MSPEGPSPDPTLELDEVELLECLRESADEVFLTMIGMVGVLVDPEDTEEAQLANYEAIVKFGGCRSGAVKLQAGHDGGLDIARGLLMLGEEEDVATDEVLDALGECANMLSGSMKCKVLDPAGGFTLGTPEVTERNEDGDAEEQAYRRLVYRLSKGCTSVEVWLDPV